MSDNERSLHHPRRALRDPRNPMHDYITREEVVTNVAKMVHAVGEKMYEQASGELAENFEALEHRLVQRIAAEFARRSLRSRVRAFWWRFFPPKPAAPVLVDAAEATIYPEIVNKDGVL